MSTVCLVLLSIDTGLKHSNSQTYSHMRSSLFSSSSESPSLSIHSIRSAIGHTLTRHDTTVPHLTVCWPCTLLIHCLELPLLSQLIVYIPFSYLWASWKSETTAVPTVLSAVAPCYIIFPYNMLYIGGAFSHHVYFQQLGKLKTGGHHVWQRFKLRKCSLLSS